MSYGQVDRSGRLERERRGDVLIVRIDGGPLGVLDVGMAEQLGRLVAEVDRDASVHAVVLTGTHPGRFVSHAEIGWLRHRGAIAPALPVPLAAVALRLARLVRRTRVLAPLAARSPLVGGLELVSVHETFTRMNRSSTIFIAALNGSALGLGAELSWACDVRLMADGDFFIGQPEILLGFPPGGGGTQRLTRLVGPRRSLMACLSGDPFTATEALQAGAVDEIVDPAGLLDRAIAIGRNLGSRPEGARRGVKRAVYFGGSRSLTAGLRAEQAEFLSTLAGRNAQDIMGGYIDKTRAPTASCRCISPMDTHRRSAAGAPTLTPDEPPDGRGDVQMTNLAPVPGAARCLCSTTVAAEKTARSSR